ncbi:hypothetical protein JQS30_10855 [Natronoglycomyces albus]|uniref:DUF5753 domain-containing protein n=2 Tax=Natronoglycomyces albus TaxID=2811108 RepID=A0A895XRQ5_9ACTN|nr:hypothetical protein JQS30_10855 [Natronoglycomyces albus]
MLVDGLLQTREYAHALISYFAEPDASDDQINNLVDIRMERKRIFGTDSPTKLSVIIEESVLRTKMGSHEVQQEQLRYLLEQSKLHHIEVRVMGMENGLHGGIDGAFHVYDMPRYFQDIALAMTQGGSLYIEEPDVERLRLRWAKLVEEARTLEDSTNLIKTLVEGNP